MRESVFFLSVMPRTGFKGMVFRKELSFDLLRDSRVGFLE